MIEPQWFEVFGIKGFPQIEKGSEQVVAGEACSHKHRHTRAEAQQTAAEGGPDDGSQAIGCADDAQIPGAVARVGDIGDVGLQRAGGGGAKAVHHPG